MKNSNVNILPPSSTTPAMTPGIDGGNRLLDVLDVIREANEVVGVETYQMNAEALLDRVNARLEARGEETVKTSTMYNYLKRLRDAGWILPVSRTVETHAKLLVGPPEPATFPSLHVVDEHGVEIKPSEISRDAIFTTTGETTLRMYEVTPAGVEALTAWRNE